MRMLTGSIGLVLSVAIGACDNRPTGPSSGALVTFEVRGEQYRAQLDEPAQVEAARRAQQGGSARIPNGRLVSGTRENVGWSWHVEDVTFAEATIEVCDGLPSHVEREGIRFGGGRLCPWSATVVSIVER